MSRWTYTKGSRAEGVIIYDDDTKIHSHHDTDPAHGQQNSWDVVRLHKFGHLDTPGDLEKSVTERPSHKAMIGFAAELPEVQTAVVASEFTDLGPLVEFTTAAPGAAPVLPSRKLQDVLRSPSIPRWLLRDKLERGVLAIMAGPRGSYKSFIAMDWALTVCVEQNLPVYVVSAEGGDFDRRAKAWLITSAPKRASDDLPMIVLERRIDLSARDNIELIRQDCTSRGVRPVLFVLDTFSKLISIDESDNTAVKNFLTLLSNGLQRDFDATVLLIAHTGHTEKGRPRGASVLEADTDAAYIVSRNDTLKNVSITRQRFKSSPELEPLWLEPKIVDLGYEDHEARRVTSLVMTPVLKKDQPVSSIKGLNARQQTGLKLVSAALAGTPDGTLTSDQLVDLMVNTTVKPAPGERDTRSQIARRTLQALLDKEVLFMKRTGRDAVARSEFTEEFE